MVAYMKQVKGKLSWPSSKLDNIQWLRFVQLNFAILTHCIADETLQHLVHV